LGLSIAGIAHHGTHQNGDFGDCLLLNHHLLLLLNDGDLLLNQNGDLLLNDYWIRHFTSGYLDLLKMNCCFFPWKISKGRDPFEQANWQNVGNPLLGQSIVNMFYFLVVP
jgi:hypothetical protein